MKLRLNSCERCGGSAAIRTEHTGHAYKVRAVCESCGARGRPAITNREPGPAVEKWATMYWNCGLYEEVKEHDRRSTRGTQGV